MKIWLIKHTEKCRPKFLNIFIRGNHRIMGNFKEEGIRVTANFEDEARKFLSEKTILPPQKHNQELFYYNELEVQKFKSKELFSRELVTEDNTINIMKIV